MFIMQSSVVKSIAQICKLPLLCKFFFFFFGSLMLLCLITWFLWSRSRYYYLKSHWKKWCFQGSHWSTISNESRVLLCLLVAVFFSPHDLGLGHQGPLLQLPPKAVLFRLSCKWEPTEESFHIILGEVFWACPFVQRPQGRPRTHRRDHISLLAWVHIGISPEDLEEDAEKRKGLLPPRPGVW